MSRIGRMPVVVPQGVQVAIAGGVVTAKGPKGELSEKLQAIDIAQLVARAAGIDLKAGDEDKEAAS